MFSRSLAHSPLPLVAKSHFFPFPTSVATGLTPGAIAFCLLLVKVHYYDVCGHQRYPTFPPTTYVDSPHLHTHTPLLHHAHAHHLFGSLTRGSRTVTPRALFCPMPPHASLRFCCALLRPLHSKWHGWSFHGVLFFVSFSLCLRWRLHVPPGHAWNCSGTIGQRPVPLISDGGLSTTNTRNAEMNGRVYGLATWTCWR